MGLSRFLLPQFLARCYPAGMKTSFRLAKLRSYLPTLLLLGLAIYSACQWWSTSDELAVAREATVDLTGTVTLDSLPLQSGVFQLTSADGQTIGVPIANGKFHIAAVPAGEWKQRITGPGVPSLYNDSGSITIDSNIRSLQFGLKGTEQLELHALSLLDRVQSK